ncbi:phosphate acyltransferase PlsX [Desulfopila inferna]|uniref:phosphate acyltransferase PlsX n=1 Tax=Desulfopila inferna TaxID=468528 RepID=UPI001965A147|nr:phosphate acyltransferase PlsX [Desulfopila inferna]
MHIALDAMGGDYGPEELITGALQAVKQAGIKVTLVGDAELLQSHIDKLPDESSPVSSLEIVHASEVVGMDEYPVDAIRRKKDSSIMVAFDLARSKKVDGVVSAGNSGATMAAALRKLGRVKNVVRPGIASMFPTLKRPVVIMDIGANVDCRPLHLFQFAVMASAFASLYDVDRPRVGILSIGEESGKGNSLVRVTYELLQKSSLNFIGNVEGRDVYKGDVDVIVCDGFVGNNILKVSEGLVEAVMQMLKNEIIKSPLAKMGYLLARPAINRFKKRVDYTEYGGAPLLGINGTGIVCHGKSNAQAIKNAILEAVKMVENNVKDKILKDLEKNQISSVDS